MTTIQLLEEQTIALTKREIKEWKRFLKDTEKVLAEERKTVDIATKVK